jgi:hypothetical protein
VANLSFFLDSLEDAVRLVYFSEAHVDLAGPDST